MGTPIDTEGTYEEGNACTRCWGPGRAFGDAPTPKFLCFIVENIEKCPIAPIDPPNGFWVLEQNAVNPNIWARFYGPYYFYWEFDAGFTFCWILDNTLSWFWFWGENYPVCANLVENDLQVCGGARYGKKGTVRLAYTKNPIAAALLLEYNLNRHENSFMESWPIEDGIEVVRYANLQTPMCVYVKHDSNLAEMHLEPFGPG